MCPDNDGLRWLVKSVARGQLRRGGSLPAQPGAAGVPCGGISQHPPERRRATLFRKPRAPRDAPTPPASSPVLVAATAQPGWLSRCRPHVCSPNVSRWERNLGMPKHVGRAGGWRRLRTGSVLMDQAHPQAPCCPGEPSCHRGATPPRGHSGMGWMPSSNRASGNCRGTPGAVSSLGLAAPRPPPPAGCGKLSKRADGAGEQRQRGGEQKRLFSHATYFTSRTFCAFQPCL